MQILKRKQKENILNVDFKKKAKRKEKENCAFMSQKTGNQFFCGIPYLRIIL